MYMNSTLWYHKTIWIFLEDTVRGITGLYTLQWYDTNADCSL